jgi:hypothetical protein
MNSHLLQLATTARTTKEEAARMAALPHPPPTARAGAVLRRKADGSVVRLRASSEALRRLRER